MLNVYLVALLDELIGLFECTHVTYICQNTQFKPPVYSSCFFFEKEDDPRPLHLGDAYGHFINYSHKTLQSNTTVRLKPPSKHLYPADEGAQIAWA